MTYSKLIERIVAFGPSVIVPHTKTPNHCILATAVAVDVLRTFDEDAQPLAVRVVIANAIATTAMRRDASLVSAVARGGHVMDTGDDGAVDGTNWRGHLVAWLPARGVVVDLNHGGFARPQHGITLPAATVLQFQPPSGEYRDRDGVTLTLVARPDDRAWTAARDWCERGRRAAMVAELSRAIRTGRLTRKAGAA